MSKDTIPKGSRLVLWSPIHPKILRWNGKYIVVYDYELTMMMIKQWRDGGMSREEVFELLFWDAKPIPKSEVNRKKPEPVTEVEPPKISEVNRKKGGRFYSQW